MAYTNIGLSLADFKLQSQSAAMQDLIGFTRSKRPVYITLEYDGDLLVPIGISQFEKSPDRYDTVAISEAYAVRGIRVSEGEEEHFAFRLRILIQKLIAATKPDDLSAQAELLKHRSSVDRIRYGQSLLHVAYRR